MSITNTSLLKKSTYGVLAVFSLSLFLTGCSKTIEKTKTDFVVQTQNIEDFSKTFVFKKTGKLVGEQEITVSSQVNGQVQQILLSNGDVIEKNQKLMTIKDTIANYNLKTQQARVALDSSKIQYEQTKISLQKAIDDTKLALENAQNGLETTIKTSEQQLKKAKQDYDNASLSGNSVSSLNIDNTVADINTNINNLKKQFIIQKNSILNFVEDVAYFSDNLFGVTNKYKTNNDSFEVYLSAKDTSIKNKVETEIYLMYTIKSLLTNIKTDGLSNKELIAELDKIDGYYKKIENLLNNIYSALSSSVDSSSFPKSAIDGYIAKNDGLQSKQQQLYANFITYKNGAYTLLQTGNVNETLTDQKIELLKEKAKEQEKTAKIALDTTTISTKNAIFNAQQQVKNMELAYNTAKKNYKNQLDLLQNQIDNANINYKQSLTQSSKLYIKSPIYGIVSQVLIDQGQDIVPGTPLFKLSSNNDPIVEVGMTKEEYNKIKQIENIFVQIDNDLITGHLLSVSKTASNNGLYTTKVYLEKSVPLLGEVVDVYFHIKSQKHLIPLSYIQPTSKEEAIVYILKTGNILSNSGAKNIQSSTKNVKQKKETNGQRLIVQPAFIKVGEVWGDEVELESILATGTSIIISDTKNYDPNFNNLKLRK